MKHNEIHRKVVKRLLLVWVALSVVIGAGVLYLGIRAAEEQVLRQAIEESRQFGVHDLQYFNRPGDEHRRLLARKAQALLDRHFIWVKLYGRAKDEIARAVAPGMEATESAMKMQHAHLLPGNGTARHSSAFVQQRVLMHLWLPLHEDDGRLAGYFEGVYHVDAAMLAHIRDNLIRALGLVVLVTFAAAAALYPVIVSLNRDLIRLATDLMKGNLELMEVLGCAVALRDTGTGAHNYRVTIYATRLAEEIGLPADRMRRLVAGAFLHDVGKIGVSDNILLKPSAHNDDESRRMRAHVTLGVEILEKSAWLQHARDVVECHHEKYDGSGYPRGLQGEAIPLNARIFAIADVFDALVSRRPYKEPFGFDDAIAMLARERGRHFDPTLLDAFTRIAPAVYAEIHAADEAMLKQTLDKLVARYF